MSFARCFGHLRHENRLRALSIYSLERSRARGDLIQVFKIVKGLAEIQDHRGTLFQVRGECNTWCEREKNLGSM